MHAVAHRYPCRKAMMKQRQRDGGADRGARIERRERILENDLQMAAHGAVLSCGIFDDILAAIPDGAGGRAGQLQQAHAERRFSRTGFADDG
ncbi:hypothetical protein D3C71_470250 [compost metagenome]